MWNDHFWSPVEDVWISRFYNLSLEIPGRSCYLLFLIVNSKRLHKTITFSLMMQTYVFFGGMSLQSSPSFLERVSVNFPGIKLVWTVFGGENEKLNVCRQVLTSSTQLKTGHFTSLIGRERLRNIKKFKEMTTATATTPPQINDLIGWTRKNNRAARAARFWCNYLT